MERVRKTVLALVATASLAIPVSAQQSVTVKQIRDDGNRMMNERVAITGTVLHLVATEATTTRFYVLKDDYGMTILVRTIGEAPATNSRITIVGTVTYEPVRRELFLHEAQRSSS